MSYIKYHSYIYIYHISALHVKSARTCCPSFLCRTFLFEEPSSYRTPQHTSHASWHQKEMLCKCHLNSQGGPGPALSYVGWPLSSSLIRTAMQRRWIPHPKESLHSSMDSRVCLGLCLFWSGTNRHTSTTENGGGIISTSSREVNCFRWRLIQWLISSSLHLEEELTFLCDLLLWVLECTITSPPKGLKRSTPCSQWPAGISWARVHDPEEAFQGAGRQLFPKQNRLLEPNVTQLNRN